MEQFFLKHKDDICGSLIIDSESGAIRSYKDEGTGLSPFLGNCDERRLKKWWEARAIPASRKMIQDVLKVNNCLNTKVYLAKNLALSLTDSYWICPIDTELSYNDFNFQDFSSYNNGKIPFHNNSSFDPNASLGGQMEKYWDLNTDKPILVKESYRNYGQQAINELFATMLHKKQNSTIPFVEYSVCKTEDGGLECHCDSFTNKHIELVSAYEVIEGSKTQNDLSTYNNYIEICTKLGIDRNRIQDFMDYQTLTDFIISNSDEHLANFGILRSSDTFEYVDVAPIYDSGNSMFYNERKVYSRCEMLQRTITSFYKTEEKLLHNIKNKNIVKTELLPTNDELFTLYSDYGVPQEKISIIASNYNTKIEMVKDLQRGIHISLYNEKKKCASTSV